MVNFEAQLSFEKKEIARNAALYGAVEARRRHLEWENGFIDYGGLKESLKSLKCSVDEHSKAGGFVKKRFVQSSQSLTSLVKGYVQRNRTENVYIMYVFTKDNSVPNSWLYVYVLASFSCVVSSFWYSTTVYVT